MNAPARTLSDLRALGIALLRQYQATPEGSRTPLVRDFASLIVDVRAFFHKPDGSVDWAGRTYAYRSFISEMYAEANIDGDSRSAVQSSVRYHVGGVLRERLAPKELEANGLNSPSPKARSNVRRQAQMDVYRAMGGGSFGYGSDPAVAISAALNLLRHIDRERFESMSDAEKNLTVERLDELWKTVRSLRNALSHASRA